VNSAVEDAVKTFSGLTMETRSSQPPAVRQPQQPVPAASRQPSASAHGCPYNPPWRGSAQRRRTGMNKGMVRLVLGILGLVVFGVGAVIFAALNLVSVSVFRPLTAGFGAMAALSAVFTGSGAAASRLSGRARQYDALFDKKPVCTLAEMAAATGHEPKKIRKNIKRAQKQGMLRDLRFDAGETCVIRGEEAWRQYLESRKTMAERAAEEEERQRRLADPVTAGLEAFRGEGVETIRQIRRANDAIPGEEISGKLSRLEGTCARIFSYVERYPEKLPETRKFMNYYLPTTLKLVEKYREFEEMDFQPENVRQAKEDIERSLDTIDLAFNNMLESLFQRETLDVATEIEVLEQMLEQEGLMGSNFEMTGERDAPGLK
jgi:hypothetical protein